MSSTPVLRMRRDGIIFLNTYTKMKMHAYRSAAQFQSVASEKPQILIVAANQLARIKSAIENTGTTEGNSRQKIDEAKAFIEMYHDRIELQDRFKKYCADAGFRFSEDKVFFAGDDTCLYLPAMVWEEFKESASALRVSLQLVMEADREFVKFEVDSQSICFRGPGVSTTYFISSMGVDNYRDTLYQAGHNAGVGISYPILRRSTLTARRLSEKDCVEKFVGTSIVRLIGENCPNRNEFPHEVHSDNAFFALYDQPDRPISSFLDEHAGKYDSYAKAYTKLIDAHFPVRSRSLRTTSTAPHLDTPDRWLIVQQMGDDARQLPLTLRSFADDRFRSAPPIDASSPMALLNLDPHIDGADAFILPPPESDKMRDLRWWAYVMYSLIVAIKTHPRDAEKIVVVMVDNKTRPFLQLYFDLANGGWTDDFPVSDGIEHHQAHQHNGLRHIQTGMCHFLVASDPTASFPMEAAEYAANDIFELHEQSSARLPPSFSKYSTAPIAVEAMRDLEPADVSFMCTSHSELRDLHGDCELIGKFLAASGRSAVWPGNDRNNMKSLYNALTGCRRLIGVITEHLADAATWNGKIPDCTHPIMASHIYERTLLLIMLGKMHAIFPVGVGGILEIACRLLLDDHFPDFRDRPAIFYSPDYARAGSRGLLDTIVALFLGEAEYRSICQGVYSNASGRRCPYYLVRNLNDLRNLISNLSISRGSPYGM